MPITEKSDLYPPLWKLCTDFCKLLVEEIPNNHLGCIKLINIGINYLSTGAGFLPSTVSPEK